MAALDVPTLVVHGTADALVPIATNGHRFIAEINGAKLLEFEGGEHAAIFSNRDDARAKVTDFLRRHSTRED
jgi:non-heme chloroperoxidase